MTREEFRRLVERSSNSLAETLKQEVLLKMPDVSPRPEREPRVKDWEQRSRKRNRR